MIMDVMGEKRRGNILRQSCARRHDTPWMEWKSMAPFVGRGREELLAARVGFFGFRPPELGRTRGQPGRGGFFLDSGAEQNSEWQRGTLCVC